MANLTVFIDETGTFSRGSKKSYIGGWLCKSNEVSSIGDIIKKSVADFNMHLKEAKIESSLNYPDDMHFMPMHLLDQRNGKDGHITIPTQQAPYFFESLFESINKITLQVFRSTGKPAIKVNEQAVYIDILRNTLLQILDNSDIDLQDLKLEIVIAHRRKRSLYGDEGYAAISAYEEHLSEELRKELLSAYDSRKPTINIVFRDARHTAGLMIADFFCGAMRWKKNDYLESYTNQSKYPFEQGYKQIGPRLIQRIRYIQETDEPLAALLCVDVLSDDPRNEEVSIFLAKLINTMTHTDKVIFCKNTIEFIEERINNASDYYAHLDKTDALLDALLKLISANKLQDYSQMQQSELQLIAALYLNKIQIESHTGKISNRNSINIFTDFLDKYGEYAFDNQMQIMQQRIDAALVAVQVEAFNRFKFDDIETILQSIKTQYYAMFHFEPETRPIKDNNLARIEGTLGQMYGFQCDIEKNNDYYEMAELCLKTDISACIINTPSWEKANGYLTSLYWKQGYLDLAIEQFLQEAKSENTYRDDIFNLNKSTLFGGNDKPFIQLHRLYLCALAAKNKQPIQGLLTAKERLLTDNDVSAYPTILSAKWLAILFLMQGDQDNALAILAAALANNHAEKFKDVINLPLQLLQHYTLKKCGKKSDFNCQSEVEDYANIQPEIKMGLLQLGIEKYYQQDIDWDIYDIGTFLPYYLS